MGQYTLREALKRAIEKEIDAQNLYLALSRRVADRYARDALVELAGYEREHQSLLESYERGELRGGALRPEHVIDYHIAEHLEQPEIARDMPLKDVFLLAANREKAAYDFYRGLAGLHPRGPVRAALEGLAAMELEHKQRVERLYTDVAFPQTDGG